MLAYDSQSDLISVVDRQLLLYRRFATVSWSWEDIIAEVGDKDESCAAAEAVELKVKGSTVAMDSIGANGHVRVMDPDLGLQILDDAQVYPNITELAPFKLG